MGPSAASLVTVSNVLLGKEDVCFMFAPCLAPYPGQKMRRQVPTPRCWPSRIGQKERSQGAGKQGKEKNAPPPPESDWTTSQCGLQSLSGVICRIKDCLAFLIHPQYLLWSTKSTEDSKQRLAEGLGGGGEEAALGAHASHRSTFRLLTRMDPLALL